MTALDGDLFVRKATLEYFAPARYDDVLDVALRCARIGNSSVVFDGAVFRRDQLLVGGELVYAFADPHAQGSRPVPQTLREALQAYEAGESMVEVRTGGWDRLGAAARALREEVFIAEQRIPAEMEWDEADADALHAVAFNRFGAAVATGRLLLAPGAPARIGRMAVSAALRDQGLGRQVLDALIAQARERGAREVVLHAQLAARNFYLRAGFAMHGEEFVEAGIPHVEMRRAV
jgi:predicted GNAT family N-acyltransferase